MTSNKIFKTNTGLTLIEILIGVIVSSIMMAAIYTTYSIVNNTYSQVLEKAKVFEIISPINPSYSTYA